MSEIPELTAYLESLCDAARTDVEDHMLPVRRYQELVDFADDLLTRLAVLEAAVAPKHGDGRHYRAGISIGEGDPEP